MIVLSLICDKCHRPAQVDFAIPAFNSTDVRRDLQDKGWRYHKRRDLCPQCALKVLGVIGAAARRL